MELEAEMDGSIQTGTLEITPEILKLIVEIDEFNGAWAAIGRRSCTKIRVSGRGSYTNAGTF